MSTPARTFPDPFTAPDPIAESARLDQRRVDALLAKGERALARLYLALLVVAFGKAADLEQNPHDPQAAKRAEANLLASRRFREKLGELVASIWASGLGVEQALEGVKATALLEHEDDRPGAVFASRWRQAHNPHWPDLDSHGYTIRVEARLKGEAYVTVQILFPDAGRSQFCPSRLCSSHTEALSYAGKMATLAEALIAVEVEANRVEALKSQPTAEPV